MNLTIMSMTPGHNFIHMLNLPLHEKPLVHQDFVPSICTLVPSTVFQVHNVSITVIFSYRT